MKSDFVDHSDEALAALVSSREEPDCVAVATEELLSRYRGRIYRWCRRYTDDHEGALDLAQVILMKVNAALPRFSGRARVSTWIFAITRNECVSAMRRRTPRTADDQILDLVADSAPGPERRLIEHESEQRLLQLIEETLDPVEQDALWLRCFERLGVDEITRTLEIAGASGARGVLQNARRKLRAALERDREPGGAS